ncbi:MAG: efflux RND transporter periplasmic adaptor subunit [Gemmobacter sp.]|nr:efflux RND transporter periplasmic adaptor subunit [Gemmobacter sp.]
MEFSVIRSPVSGVVISRQIDIGQTVAAHFNTPTLFQIARDLTQMQIEAAVAEADIAKVKPGQNAWISPSMPMARGALPARSTRCGSIR